ncbi:MAG: N-6 DNA methylase [Flavobacteriaceae bacterium]|nr:N-6 DNA methylase [Flavobacteriaceae bacterium]
MFVGKKVRGYKVQPSLFNLYDFEIIPVELISNIYESFLGNTIYSKEKINIPLSKQKEVKAYYTPSILVDYVISQTVKPFLRENIKLQCRVLDPSCGSGIFLVESLRQIINNEIKTKSSYNRNGTELISNNRLWELLQENIFGIDIDQNAIEIAIFSLYITLLDYKTKPCEIENFEFKNLKDKNLFGGDDADFFNESNVFNNLFKNEINLDFVIGNPPWGTVPKSSYVDYIKKRATKEKENNTSSVALKIYKKEISQAFMVRIGDLIQDEASTKICFIITGKNLYNSDNNARQWRKYLLTNFNIHQCFDLFGMNNGIAGGKQLFENTRQPPAILIYSKKNAMSKKGDNFKHITARANLYYHYFKTIVIEKSDVKVVNQNILLNDDKLWKLLMYGNSLDYMFIKRLRNRGKKISSIMQEHDLKLKGGFKSRDSKIPQDKRKDTKHLWHYDYVEVGKVEGLDQYQVLFNKTFKDELEDLSRSGKINDDFKVAQLPDLKVFGSTKLLLKKGLKMNSGYSARSVSAVTKENCVFSSTIASITSLNSQTSNEQEDILYMMSAIFNSKLFAYYLLMTSSSFGAGRNRVNFVEFLNIPLVWDKNLGNLSRNLHKLYLEEKLLNSNESEILELKDKIESRIQKIYKVSDVEEELINYALNVSIPVMKRADLNRSKPPSIFRRIDKKNLDTLEDFVNIFVGHFSKRFNNEDRQFLVDVYLNNDFVALHFIISEKRKKTVEFYRDTKLDEAIKKIGNLGVNEVSRNLFIQQDVRGFNENSFYLIKPNIAKNWHLALAHKDLIEFIEAIAISEMKHAKVTMN